MARCRASLSRRAASARLRSVMSRAMVEAPKTRPSSSTSGEIVRATSIRVPSFRTRTVSHWVIRSPRSAS